MKHYDYTKEMDDALAALKEVKDTRKHEKLYVEAPKAHQPVLRKAYKQAMRMALLNLSMALDAWALDRYRIENDDKE